MTQHKIKKTRRQYNQWVATETLEDYALRYSPSSFRKWSPFLISNTAIGSISFLALEAIGATLFIDFGFTIAFWAIAFASLIIFLCSAPIAYYCARYNIDIDLLTRSAGFGYVGSTITSLIYASFCFIFFALEAAIMAQALKLYFQLPLYLGYIVCSLLIIPLVFYGITLINRLHLWTQPVWIILMLTPFYFVLVNEPGVLEFMSDFSGKRSGKNEFNPYYFGIAAGVSLSLIAQIGEQVDYLRFMPDKNKSNKISWWIAVLAAGPGWIILGFLKQIGGVLLASLVLLSGLAIVEAKEPVQMYYIAYSYVFENKQLALLVTLIFVVISQIKINVTNAYAGSLAWSNFFSRVTHFHPGRVVWLVFNIAIALLLMEIGVFQALEMVLGLYSNVAVAWIGAIVADLVINKPLGLSPPMVEFKRGHLFDYNPVGFFSMFVASFISIAAFSGLFGHYAQAYSSLIALSISFVLAPVIAKITKGKYYIARQNEHYGRSDELETCGICKQKYAQTDFSYCSYYETPICSLCCTLDSSCHDDCKAPKEKFYFQLVNKCLNLFFQNKVSKKISNRVANFLLLWSQMLAILAVTLWMIFSVQAKNATVDTLSSLSSSFSQVFWILTVFTSIAAWWIELINESRDLAEIELKEQNQALASEIVIRRRADQQANKFSLELRQQTDSLQQNFRELTETHRKLAESEQLFRKLIKVQSAIFWRVDIETMCFTFVSEQAELISGYSIDQWLSKGFWEKHLHPEDKTWAIEYCINEIKQHRNHEFEYRIISAKGEVIWLRDIVSLVIEKGKVIEILGFMVDITQSKKIEEELELTAKVFAQSQEAILVCDRNNKIISVNQAFFTITGYSAEEAQGSNPKILSSGRHDHDFFQSMWEEILATGGWQGEIWNRRKNGEIYPEWMSISVVRDRNDNITNYISIFSDISQHKETEARIEHLAHYDSLTDLPNRILLKAHVDYELTMAERNNSTFALLFLDLDHFKNINDSLGHSVGDKVLIEIANRLKAIVREEDTVSRLGGDEFNILLPITDFTGASIVAEKILDGLSKPIYIEQNQLHIFSSIGVSLFPENGRDYETLSKNADTALYQSKEKGRNQYQFFTQEMQDFTVRRIEIERHLRTAIQRNELQVFYQPQVESNNFEIVAVEALLRWHHPKWGVVAPAEFIPVAEDCGLIISIGDWVLEQAIVQVKKWHDMGYSKISVAVNLSLAQFNEKILIEKIALKLKKVNLEPHFLELELTESIAMKNAETAIKVTQQLAKLGVQLSIDDFGTGYSSLRYLQHFALHKLKIDQSFSKKMVENTETDNIVNAIISMAKSLNLKTIAEGVETEQQLKMLKSKGCDHLQGYYFSKPVSADELVKLLRCGFIR